jgi:hypothetical protein
VPCLLWIPIIKFVFLYSYNFIECYLVASGLLGKGLVQAVVTINLNCDDTMKLFTIPPPNAAAQKLNINSAKFIDARKSFVTFLKIRKYFG